MKQTKFPLSPRIEALLQTMDETVSVLCNHALPETVRNDKTMMTSFYPLDEERSLKINVLHTNIASLELVKGKGDERFAFENRQEILSINQYANPHKNGEEQVVMIANKAALPEMEGRSFTIGLGQQVPGTPERNRLSDVIKTGMKNLTL